MLLDFFTILSDQRVPSDLEDLVLCALKTLSTQEATLLLREFVPPYTGTRLTLFYRMYISGNACVHTNNKSLGICSSYR